MHRVGCRVALPPGCNRGPWSHRRQGTTRLRLCYMKRLWIATVAVVVAALMALTPACSRDPHMGIGKTSPCVYTDKNGNCTYTNGRPCPTPTKACNPP